MSAQKIFFTQNTSFLNAIQKILVWSEKQVETYIRSPKNLKVRKNVNFALTKKI